MFTKHVHVGTVRVGLGRLSPTYEAHVSISEHHLIIIDWIILDTNSVMMPPPASLNSLYRKLMKIGAF